MVASVRRENIVSMSVGTSQLHVTGDKKRHWIRDFSAPLSKRNEMEEERTDALRRGRFSSRCNGSAAANNPSVKMAEIQDIWLGTRTLVLGPV